MRTGFHFTEPLRPDLIILNFISTFVVGIVVLIVQQTLSLMSDNPTYASDRRTRGSFLGLFSMYFPRAVSVLYSGVTLECLHRSEWTGIPGHVANTYFDIPFPTTDFCDIFNCWVIIYLAGITFFEKGGYKMLIHCIKQRI